MHRRAQSTQIQSRKRTDKTCPWQFLSGWKICAGTVFLKEEKGEEEKTSGN
jgi:hypothetical protein